MAFYVYLLASQRNGTLYIGVTNDLVRRVGEHKDGVVPGFTRRYNVKLLVYFEVFDDARTAIQREKHMKEWRRAWKLALIEKANPQWRDLYDEIAR
jgi:putative endonuclease